MPCKTGSEEDNQDEGMSTQAPHLFTYIERSTIPVLVALNGQRIRDNVRPLSQSTRCGTRMLTFSSRPSTIGW